jgi:hypothetical protein
LPLPSLPLLCPRPLLPWKYPEPSYFEKGACAPTSS